jgi:hypothetical protein
MASGSPPHALAPLKALAYELLGLEVGPPRPLGAAVLVRLFVCPPCTVLGLNQGPLAPVRRRACGCTRAWSC